MSSSIFLVGFDDQGEEHVEDLSHLLHLVLELIDFADEIFVALGHLAP